MGTIDSNAQDHSDREIAIISCRAMLTRVVPEAIDDDTPQRFVDALAEMTSGYKQDPNLILSKCFDAKHDEMILLNNIAFVSLCEHHVLPFIGTASVAYIPGKVVGISKLARLVECYAKRLQIQERMTQQIADAVEDNLDPVGVAVKLVAHHACMGCRGVRQPSARMVTSVMRGIMKDSESARMEFLNLSENTT